LKRPTFPEQWGSSLPPAIGTPHKSLLMGLDGPSVEAKREQDASDFVPFVVLFQLGFMRIVFQSANFCLEGPGKS